MSLLKSLLEEMGTVSTGTGAAFTPGQGEQIASPFAFKKKKKIKEATPDIVYSEELIDKIYAEHLKKLPEMQKKLERYLNVFEAYNVREIIEDTTKAEKLGQLGEQLYEQIYAMGSKIEDAKWSAEDLKDGRKRYKELSSLEDSYKGLADAAEAAYQAVNTIVEAIEKAKEDGYKLSKTIEI